MKRLTKAILITLSVVVVSYPLSLQIPDSFRQLAILGLIASILLYLFIKIYRKPEKYIDKWGYVVLTKPNELEHRYIAKELLNRNLTYHESVHHINGKKIDNRVENLCLMSREKHEHFHAWLDWKKRKSGYYPPINDQKSILEKEYSGTLLEKISPQKRTTIKNPLVPQTERQLLKIKKVIPRDQQKNLFQELRKERKRIAEQKNIPVYLVLNNRTLYEMSEKMPISEEMMLHIRGIGPTKMSMYGWNFLTIIKIFKENEDDRRKRSGAV